MVTTSSPGRRTSNLLSSFLGDRERSRWGSDRLGFYRCIDTCNFLLATRLANSDVNRLHDSWMADCSADLVHCEYPKDLIYPRHLVYAFMVLWFSDLTFCLLLIGWCRSIVFRTIIYVTPWLPILIFLITCRVCPVACPNAIIHFSVGSTSIMSSLCLVRQRLLLLDRVCLVLNGGEHLLWNRYVWWILDKRISLFLPRCPHLC